MGKNTVLLPGSSHSPVFSFPEIRSISFFPFMSQTYMHPDPRTRSLLLNSGLFDFTEARWLVWPSCSPSFPCFPPHLPLSPSLSPPFLSFYSSVFLCLPILLGLLMEYSREKNNVFMIKAVLQTHGTTLQVISCTTDLKI